MTRAGPLAADRPRAVPFAFALLLALVVAVSACGSNADEVTTATNDRAATSVAPSVGTAAILAEPAELGSPATSDAVTAPAPTSPAPSASAPATTPAEATDVVENGPAPVAAPYPIGTVNLALVDPTRPTVTGATTISSTRSLPTVVAYPTGGGGPYPLLVFAHGYRLGPPGYTRLIATLAAAGYVVAAPTFPLGDGPNADRGDIPNQAGDLTVVIDGVLAASADPGSPLAGRVDGARIGAVGHSDGADTVLELGYHPARADARVRAIVALSPDAVTAPTGQAGGSTPLLLEHGDADPIVPYTESVSVFSTIGSHRYFLTLLGGGHLEPVAQTTAWTPLLDATITAFLDRYVAGGATTEDAIVGPPTASTIARIQTAG